MRPAAGGGDDPGIRYALGGGAMLLTGLCVALLMAFVMSRTLGGLYITLVMPALAGWILGGGVGWVAARFALEDRAPVVLTVVLTGTLAYAGYQLLAYTQVIDLLVEHLTTAIERATVNPTERVLEHLERETGEQGVTAYLAFVSTPPGSELSPVGLLGRGGIGVGGTVLLIVGELGALIGAGLVSATRRLRPAAAASADVGGALRQVVIARPDDAGVATLMAHVEAAEFEEAGRALAERSGPATHAVVIEHVPGTSAPWRVSIRALEADGALGVVRAERRVSAFDGQALWDELRMARRAGDGRDGDDETA